MTSSTPLSRHLGFRPDEPPPTGIRETACEEYIGYFKYATELEEAYLARATQNRWWIYVAGTTALGVAAASGGLAAASAATLTLALLSISGGFASGFFAFLDNGTLADIYTVAQNRVAEGRERADAQLKFIASGTSRYQNPEACAAALASLRKDVTEARNLLERARTDSAAAAIERAQAQVDRLEKSIEAKRQKDLTAAIRGARVTEIDKSTVKKGEATEITLSITGGDFRSVAPRDREPVRVVLGDADLPAAGDLDASGKYIVRFRAPATPPQTNEPTYSPVVLVGTGRQRIESDPKVTLKYTTE